ncbi:hypothetical protein [Nostoc sp. PA-18-2419]|uniref:hypothetical protein n=1 Tax=Nostoc sp. PA-18-2419 TaxID=2575443 RepID=UPI001CB8C595|nr:hypothetical protein [Nostoc sp. PA-18-2419]
MGEKLVAQKQAGRPIKLMRMKIAALGARLLFRELVKAHESYSSTTSTTTD